MIERFYYMQNFSYKFRNVSLHHVNYNTFLHASLCDKSATNSAKYLFLFCRPDLINFYGLLQLYIYLCVCVCCIERLSHAKLGESVNVKVSEAQIYILLLAS